MFVTCLFVCLCLSVFLNSHTHTHTQQLPVRQLGGLLFHRDERFPGVLSQMSASRLFVLSSQRRASPPPSLSLSARRPPLSPAVLAACERWAAVLQDGSKACVRGRHARVCKRIARKTFVTCLVLLLSLSLSLSLSLTHSRKTPLLCSSCLLRSCSAPVHKYKG